VRPETRYAKSGDVHIAYQVLGDGPLDLVYVAGWISNIEAGWNEPRYAHFFERLASFSRVILFDKRGTGLSDRVPENELPSLEVRMDDVRAVMDAAGSERAAVFGMSEGGSMSMLFAATYPERTRALVLAGCFAKRLHSLDYPWAPTLEERERWLASVEETWGTAADLADLAPSVADDPVFRQWWAGYGRQSASPRAAVALGRMNTHIDVRDVLPTIRVPTLILHRVGDRDVNIEEARYMAARIPGARLVELPGSDHLVWTDNADRLLDEVEEFLTGARPVRDPDRVLATVLFTDIVRSTERAAAMGDQGWRMLLLRHDAAVREEIDRHRGRAIKSTGDGFLATFDGPARGIRCAAAIRRVVREMGLEIRAGLHTGECEVLGDDLGGVALHIAARVMAHAAPGEILVSGTVRDLVSGSGIAFADRGRHTLKGVPGEWALLSIEHV
jgi:pimeloyl-ACP methyl ester carboxylesterase